MLRPFALIMSFSFLSSFCAGVEPHEIYSEPMPNPFMDDEPPSGIPLPSAYEDDLEEQKRTTENAQPKDDESFERACQGFSKKYLRDIRVSGPENVVKLRGDNGLHLKIKSLGKTATVRIVASPLQKDLSRLCVSVPRGLEKLTLQIDTKVHDVIVKTQGSRPLVEIDTGDHGIMERLASESSGRKPAYFLKGAGVYPCKSISQEYSCE